MVIDRYNTPAQKEPLKLSRKPPLKMSIGNVIMIIDIMTGALNILLIGWFITEACAFTIKAGGIGLQPSGFHL